MDGARKKCSGDSLRGQPDQRSADKQEPPRYRAEQRRSEHEPRGGMRSSGYLSGQYAPPSSSLAHHSAARSSGQSQLLEGDPTLGGELTMQYTDDMS